MAEHNTLTGTSLHEPKGAAAANVGEVYIADGAGSGSWGNPSVSAQEGELTLGVTTNNAVATTIAALDSYFVIGGTWVQQHVHGAITTIPGTGLFTIGLAGDYKVIATWSGIASQINRNWNFSLLVNGVQTGNVRIRRSINSTTDTGAFGLSATLTGLSIGDTVQMCVAGLTGDTPPTVGQTFTMQNASFGISLIGVN